jgi:hypothetical protein
MKRQKLAEGQGQYRWLGSSSVRLKNEEQTIIKPKQVFVAYPAEIPKGFMDLVEVIVEGKDNSEKLDDVEKHQYSVKEKAAGWFDVVDDNGKVINEKSLREDAANKMVEELNQ